MHAQLQKDTLPLTMLASGHVRLMNDQRWPWLIVIPHNDRIEELHHFSSQQCTDFMADIARLSALMQRVTSCSSVNVAMLGNVVSQLHCHVVARDPGDPNWPAPIWGYETAIAYAATDATATGSFASDSQTSGLPEWATTICRELDTTQPNPDTTT